MMQRWDYEYIILQAESGDPHSMLEVAKLNKAGAFGDINIQEYVYWLKQFFDTPQIKYLVGEYEDNYSPDNPVIDNPRLDEDAPVALVDEYILRNDIIEAGLALGIYYMNSSVRKELMLSRDSFMAALDASACDYLTVDSLDGQYDDIVSILVKIQSRLERFG